MCLIVFACAGSAFFILFLTIGWVSSSSRRMNLQVVRGEKVGAIQRDTTEEITRTAEEHSQKRQKVQS